MSLSDITFKQMEIQLAKSNDEHKVEYNNTEKIIIDPNAELSFAALADCQISNYMYARQYSFSQACEDISETEGIFDALVICGDIAENGYASEYKMTSKLINGISSKYNHFIAMPGNHDLRLRRFDRQLLRFNQFLLNTDKSIALTDKYWFSKEIKGYKFIILGADSSAFEGSYISKEQLKWLDKEIASTQNSGKPVFVFNHQPLKFTNGLPSNWLGNGDWRGSVGNESGLIRNIFNKYKNVIFITGHLHWGTNIYSVMKKDNFLAVSVPTAGAGNHGTYQFDSQGYIVTVYKDRIEFKSRVFSEKRYAEKEIDGSFCIYDTSTFNLRK